MSEATTDFSKPRTQPLECILVGLSRTGTQSLKEAFAILGYGTIYETLQGVRRNGHGLLCAAALDAKYANAGPRFGLEQFESLWGEYRVISGEAVTPHAEELIEIYPDAKVILTVRDDEQQWLQSLLDTMWYNNTVWTTRLLKKLEPRMGELRLFMDKWWAYRFRNDPQNHGIRVYREHNALVQRVTPSERLLVYNVKEGWEPLCRFLNKDVPSVPFPRTNSVQDHRRLFAKIRQQSFKAFLTKTAARGMLALIVVMIIWRRTTLLSLLRSLRL